MDLEIILQALSRLIAEEKIKRKHIEESFDFTAKAIHDLQDSLYEKIKAIQKLGYEIAELERLYNHIKLELD